MELSGAVGIVTGGATGIGHAVCLELARAGVKGVVVNYSRSAAEAEATAQELAGLGVEALAVKADVAREDEVVAMVEAAAERFGRIDVLVNHAGTTRFIPFPDLEAVKAEVWRHPLGVHLMRPR